MRYGIDCGVKHKFCSGVIFEDDRKNYDWNCNLNSDSRISEEEILASYIRDFKPSNKIKSSIFLYE